MQWTEASRAHYASMDLLLPSNKATPAPQGDIKPAAAVSLVVGRARFVALGGHGRGSMIAPSENYDARLGRCCKQGALTVASPAAIVV